MHLLKYVARPDSFQGIKGCLQKVGCEGGLGTWWNICESQGAGGGKGVGNSEFKSHLYIFVPSAYAPVSFMVFMLT